VGNYWLVYCFVGRDSISRFHHLFGDLFTLLLRCSGRSQMAANRLHVSLRSLLHDFYGMDTESRVSGWSIAVLHRTSLATTMSLDS